mmetsp:Transcript_20822/g.58684  ORF Transcript_20822/g.58684 Transcript_20822/m.58684 type:complete len:475 (-) Transcript_20822:135-1559(-)
MAQSVALGACRRVLRRAAEGRALRRCSGAHEALLTPTSLRRRPSAIRALQPLLAEPGMISLGGGMPNPSTFPVADIHLTLRTGEVLQLGERATAQALQYSPTAGSPELIRHLVELQMKEHRPPAATAQDLRVLVTTGSQDALSKSFEMLLSPQDTLLMEWPSYSGALAFLEPLGCHLATTKTDGEGIIPEDMADLLANWQHSAAGRAGAPKPRVLYTIPVGSNPTGASLSVERKAAIYSIARQHGMIILEDDPYYYLQFNESARRTPSFLSMDTAGCVLRFDSFSKLMSSGLRLGFATGPSQLIERLELHQQATSLHTSGVSQAIATALFDHWQQQSSGGDRWERFEEHVAAVVGLYRAQRDAALASAERHLTGLAQWHAPSAGMFLWLRLLGVEDSSRLVKEEAVREKVILVPGGAFAAHASPSAAEACHGDRPVSPYVRASFSTSSPEQMDEAMARLARVLRRSAPEEGTAP